MIRFLQLVASQVIALLIVIFLGFAFLFLFLFGLTILLSPEPYTLEKGSALVIDLTMSVTDSPRELDPYEVLEYALEDDYIPTYPLLQVIQAIDKAGQDQKISCIYLTGNLQTEFYGSSYATLKELRKALLRFRETGKPVYAYLVGAEKRDFYVMSVADQIFMNPMGALFMNGFASERLYLKDALDKYGIDIQVVAAGDYKSAVEVFTNSQMSPEDREQLEALLGDMWDLFVEDVGASLKLDSKQMAAFLDGTLIIDPEVALEQGIVTDVAYWDEVNQRLIEQCGAMAGTETFNQVHLGTYMHEPESFSSLFGAAMKPRVAVIYAEGAIVYGEGDLHEAGSQRLSRQIHQARKDPEIEAIVLRVNSPGGSATAAEIIERELALCEKPWVVSMGGMAASGGYWIAARADHIFAEPNTITGSIGVFGGIPSFRELANNHGVTFDRVKTGPHADVFSFTRSRTSAEMADFQDMVDDVYRTFLEKTAEGRKMSIEDVRSIAGGRVWSGEDAKAIGLVDELGGLEDAIAHAASMANLGENYEIEEYYALPQIPAVFQHWRGAVRKLMISDRRLRYIQIIFSRRDDSLDTRVKSLFERTEELVDILEDPQFVYALSPVFYTIN